MKSLSFDRAWLASQKERRARVIEFHPRRNLLIGRNHTGKSTVIKSLFLALGARPEGKLQRWDKDAITLVRLNLSEQFFYVLHQSGNRALFDESGRAIGAASAHEGWTQLFNDATGFNLALTDKSLEPAPADPKCFFLPFYVNQDGSWQSKWDTFVGMQQYRSPVGAILEYFAGVKPPAYYETSSRRKIAQNHSEELYKELRHLTRARARIASLVPMDGPKLDDATFREEINTLVAQVSELNAKQEQLRERATRQREALSNIELQEKLARAAIAEYEGDVSYLRSTGQEALECPTCGAVHSESFVETLTYAEDARVLRDLISQLKGDEFVLRTEHLSTLGQLDELASRYKAIERTLDSRRGDLKFKDVVEGMGAATAFRSIMEEEHSLRREIEAFNAEISELDSRLRELTSKSRSKEILGFFRSALASAQSKLNLPAEDTSRATLVSRPKVSGSGGPRSVLAYYAALWQVCSWTYGSFSVPFVIDSPNQQGQDDINLPIVLEFLSNHLPSGHQVIVGSEIDSDFDYEKRVRFDRPYGLLRDEDWKDVSETIDPFVARMHAALTAQRADEAGHRGHER